jgi:hypothetical protein
MLKFNYILKFFGLENKHTFLTSDYISKQGGQRIIEDIFHEISKDSHEPFFIINACASAGIDATNTVNLFKKCCYSLAIEPGKFGRIMFLWDDDYEITN